MVESPGRADIAQAHLYAPRRFCQTSEASVSSGSTEKADAFFVAYRKHAKGPRGRGPSQ